MQAFIAEAVAEQASGISRVFTVRDASEKILGTTRLMQLDLANRRLEMGHTGYAASTWPTAVNTQAKRLLLGLVFDTAGAIAVAFRRHWHNRRSRTAIERLEARQDGVLRQHRVLADGSLRDTVAYSIIHGEWPAVRAALDHRLAVRGPAATSPERPVS